MEKKVWILNHHATNMFFFEGGRHHSFAKFLNEKGYDVEIFCANTRYGFKDIIDTDNELVVKKKTDSGLVYNFVKTKYFSGNGMDRIKSMITFWKNVKHVCNDKIRRGDRPDILIASSVHPLTMIAGIQIGRKNKIPCICEVRDLWPETFVAMGMMKKSALITRLLYKGEKWIYKKADAVIFTMPGGEKYIRDQNWDGAVDLNKIYHINNGVDLAVFNENQNKYKLKDSDLDDDYSKKIIYTGSIGKANKVEKLVSLAKVFKDRHIDSIKIIVFGDGEYKVELEEKCKKRNLDNIIFKGSVEKKYIPYILTKSDLNIVTIQSNNLGQYGMSWNKIFEYMASRKPVIVDYDLGEYNLIEELGFGKAQRYESIEEFCDAVIYILMESKDVYNEYCNNAEKSALLYDYKKLTEKLIEVIKKTIDFYN